MDIQKPAAKDPSKWVIDPPELHDLLKKFGGKVGDAEKAAGIPVGSIGKMRKGADPYTEATKAKVIAVLEGKTPPKPSGASAPLPETTPPILAELVHFVGSKAKAVKTLGTSDGRFYGVINGREPMPPGWEARARAHMGQSVLAAAKPPVIELPQPEGPPFVPWNGKDKRTVDIQTMGGKTRKQKNVPAPLADLLERFGGSQAHAAAAMGQSPGVISTILKGNTKFDEKRQRRVHAALHGIAPPQGVGEQFDKYTLGEAHCFLSASQFDRINDIADLLNGRMLYRKNIKGTWLIVYRMDVGDLPRFKRMAMRDAQDIICP